MDMIFIILSLLALAAFYLYHVNAAMKRVPDMAHKSSPNRWTVAEIEATYKKILESPIDVTRSLPPKQARRYVVVGGSGACWDHLHIWP